MTKKRQIKTNKRKTGGKIGYIPVLDDLTQAFYTYNTKSRSDKINNRMSIDQKIAALKELISWIELSFGNVVRSGIKSDTPVMTQIFNRSVLNRFNAGWFLKNLVSQEQLNDYYEKVNSLDTDEPTIDVQMRTTFGIKIGRKTVNRKEHLKRIYTNLGYLLLYYLKQLHILITGNKGPFESYDIDIELSDAFDLPVSEPYTNYLTKKFGETYLHEFRTNYNIVRNFFNETLLPKIKIVLPVQAEVYTGDENLNDAGDANTMVSGTRIPSDNSDTPVMATQLGGRTRKTQKRNKSKQRRKRIP
jgi:hypothetical protein